MRTLWTLGLLLGAEALAAPLLIETRPPDNHVSVARHQLQPLLLRFDQPIQPGSGDLTLWRTSTNQEVARIPSTSARLGIGGPATLHDFEINTERWQSANSDSSTSAIRTDERAYSGAFSARVELTEPWRFGMCSQDSSDLRGLDSLTVFVYNTQAEVLAQIFVLSGPDWGWDTPSSATQILVNGWTRLSIPMSRVRAPGFVRAYGVQFSKAGTYWLDDWQLHQSDPRIMLVTLPFEGINGMAYHVQASAGWVEDTLGNPWPGISNATDWNFQIRSNAPYDISLSPGTLAENTPAPAEAGTLNSSDPDPGDIHTYQLVSGLGSTHNSLMEIAGSALRMRHPPDYEIEDTLRVRVRSTDSYGNIFEKALLISVADSNETPWHGAGNALGLDGSVGFVAVADVAPLRVSAAITVEAWARLEPKPASGNISTSDHTILAKGTFDYLLNIFGMDRSNPGVVEFGSSYGGFSPNWTSGNIRVDDGRWHHIAASFDGTQVRIYVDGVLDVSVAASGTLPITSEGLTLGAWGYNRTLNGELDEVRIWNQARSQAQIRDYRYRHLLGNETGLVGYWRFDESLGLRVRDFSASGAHGILNTIDAAARRPSRAWSQPITGQGAPLLLGWGWDAEGESLNGSTVLAPNSGTLQFVGAQNAVRFTPAEAFTGSDTLAWSVLDGVSSATGGARITVNGAPAFTTGGGAATLALSAEENTRAITQFTASDPEGDTLRFQLDGGADATLFTVDSLTGHLRFSTAPDFENPTDADANNIYEVTVRVTDSWGGFAQQFLSLSITDRPERTLTWDTSTDADFQAGNGTWGTDAFWSEDGLGLQSWPGAGTHARFAGEVGTYTITVNGVQDLDSLSVLQSDYSFSGGTLQLGGPQPVIHTQARTTIGSQILVQGNLIKAGTDTLDLQGDNAISGDLYLRNGVVIATHNNALGQGTVVLEGSPNLNLGDGVVIANPIEVDFATPGIGNGVLQAPGSGVATISGPIQINTASTNGGHLRGNTGSLLRINGPITTENNTLVVRRGNVNLSGGGSYPQLHHHQDLLSLGADNGIATNAFMTLSISQNSTLDLAGYTQTLQGLVSGTAYSSAVTNSGSNASLLLNTPMYFSHTFNGTITDAITLRKLGNGTQAIVGNLSHTGTTTVEAGRLVLSGTYSAGAIHVQGNGASLDASGTFNAPLAIQSEGVLEVAGSATGGLAVQSLNLNLGARVFLDLATPGASDQIAVTDNLDLNGVLHIRAGTGFGPGTYTLLTYGGGLASDSIQLQGLPLGTQGSLTTGGGQVNLVVQSTMWTWDSSTTAGIQPASGTWGSHAWWTQDGISLGAWPGSNAVANFAGAGQGVVVTTTATPSAGGIIFSGNGFSIEGSALQLQAPAILRVADTAILAAPLQGSDGLIVEGGGLLKLIGPSSYTGGTLVRSGELEVSHAQALGSGGAITRISDSATLSLNRVAPAADTLLISGGGQNDRGALRWYGNGNRWSGPIQLLAETRIMGNAVGATLALDGPLMGNSPLRLGEGTLNVIAGSAFDGDFIAESGKLSIFHPRALGSTVGSTHILPGASLILSFNGDLEPETLYLQGFGQGGWTGTLRTGYNNISEHVRILGLTVLESDTRLNAAEVHDTLTLVGDLAGAFAWEKYGHGLLRMEGEKSATGPIRISQGVLELRGSLPGVSGLQVDSGAVLHGHGTVGGNVTMRAYATMRIGDSSGSSMQLGSLNMEANSRLQLQIRTPGSTAPLRLGGNAALAGRLDITDLPGFSTGTYLLATTTGTFSGGLTLGEQPNGYYLSLQQTASELRLVAIDMATPVAISLAADSLEELLRPGLWKAGLSTEDPNLGAVHTYTLLPSSTYPDNANFQIVGDSLVLTQPVRANRLFSLRVGVRSTNSLGTWRDEILQIPVRKEVYGEWPQTRRVQFATGGDLTLSDDLVDFPLLVRLSAADFSFASTSGDGGDLRVSSPEGIPLDFEIERWDSAAGRAEVWILLPKLLRADSGQFVRLHYGRTDKISSGDGRAVFAVHQGFRGVWHLGESPTVDSSAYRDATANSFDGTGISMIASADRSGAIAHGTQFDGARAIDLGGPNPYLSGAAEATVSGWVWKATNSNPMTVLNITRYDINPTSISRITLQVLANGHPQLLGRAVDSALYTDCQHPQSIPDSTWVHLAGSIRYATDELTIFVNGEPFTCIANPGFGGTQTESTPSYRGVIGAVDTVTELPWQGQLDEVRLLDKALRADRIRMEYENQRPGATWIQIVPNTPPTVPAFTPFPLPENSGPELLAGILSASDPDPGDRVSFALAPGAGDTDNWRFQIRSDSLFLNEFANYERQSAYAVRIQALDLDGAIADTAVLLTVLDENDAPVAGSGAALSGNGSNGSVVRTPYHAAQGLSSTATWEAHIRVQRKAPSDVFRSDHTILSKRHNSTDYILGVCGPDRTDCVGRLLFGSAGLTPETLTGRTVVDDGQWHHVAAVLDNSVLSLWVDGALDTSITVSGTLPNTTNSGLYLGATNWEASQGVLWGALDEVRVWNIPRTAQELRRYSSDPFPAGAAGLVAQYSFDEGMGKGVRDRGPHGMHGSFSTDNGLSWITSTAWQGQSIVEDSSMLWVLGWDEDGDNWVGTVLSPPAHGSLEMRGDSALYTPTADYNGVDSLTYRISDGVLYDTFTVIFTVLPRPDAPRFLRPAAGDSAAYEVFENVALVDTLRAWDPDGSSTMRYYIAGGVDSGLFELDSLSGVLRFRIAPDFETPQDANADNRYLLSVQAGDGSETTILALRITVLDVDENRPPRLSRDTLLITESQGTQPTIRQHRVVLDSVLSVAQGALLRMEFTVIDPEDDAFTTTFSSVRARHQCSLADSALHRYRCTVTLDSTGDSELHIVVVDAGNHRDTLVLRFHARPNAGPRLVPGELVAYDERRGSLRTHNFVRDSVQVYPSTRWSFTIWGSDAERDSWHIEIPQTPRGLTWGREGDRLRLVWNAPPLGNSLLRVHGIDARGARDSLVLHWDHLATVALDALPTTQGGLRWLRPNSDGRLRVHLTASRHLSVRLLDAQGALLGQWRGTLTVGTHTLPLGTPSSTSRNAYIQWSETTMEHSQVNP